MSEAASRVRSRAGLMPFSRALLIAILLEVATVLGLVVNWSELFPPPDPPPMKVEFVKLPEPPPPPPQPPQPIPKQKPPPPKEKPEPPKPEEPKPLPEPEPPPPPPPPKPEEPPPDDPPPDKKLPPVKKVRAVYPKDALSQGIEGEARARLKVGTSGKVLNVEIVESKPPGVFDYAVIKATKQYVFPPGDEEFEIDQVIVFKIEDDRYGPQSQQKGEDKK